MGAPHTIRRKAYLAERAAIIEAQQRLGALPSCATCLHWRPESRPRYEDDGWCTRGNGVNLTHWSWLCTRHEERAR